MKFRRDNGVITLYNRWYNKAFRGIPRLSPKAEPR